MLNSLRDLFKFLAENPGALNFNTGVSLETVDTTSFKIKHGYYKTVTFTFPCTIESVRDVANKISGHSWNSDLNYYQQAKKSQ